MLQVQKHVATLVVLVGGALVGTGGAVAGEECNTTFPTKPLTFQVGYAAGGGTDAISRTIARAMETQNDWVILVENKPGAGTGVMLASLKNQEPDGYTIGITSTDGVALNPAQSDMGYTYRDFEYIGSAMDSWNGLVTLSESPFDDIADFVSHAKDQGIATIATVGVGQDMMVRQLAEQFGVNIVPVPGTGASEAMMSALGGHVDATIQASLHVEEILSGRMKQLASLTRHRVPYAPDSKTLEEQGVTALPIETSIIFVVPKGIDAARKECIQVAFDNAVRSPGYKALMTSLQNEPRNMGEDVLVNFIEEKSQVYEGLFSE